MDTEKTNTARCNTLRALEKKVINTISSYRCRLPHTKPTAKNEAIGIENCAIKGNINKKILVIAKTEESIGNLVIISPDANTNTRIAKNAKKFL
jgi:hypothetical protein